MISTFRRLPNSGLSSRVFLRSFSASNSRRAEIELEVDGKKVSIEQGSSLIQACEKAGASVPRFCYHDRLNIAGNCRMCLVEVERSPKPVASCAMPAMPGSKVFTNTPQVHKAREGVMEFLLANHPLDCPICDQGGECDLQDQSVRYGSDRARFHEITGKRAVEDKDLGPLVKTVMTRCIQCTRCVRFANDVAGVDDLGTSGRGNDMQIGTYVQKTLNSEMSGNIVDLCPVGALTSKPYAFTARPWELKKTESIDVLDAVGSNIAIHSRGTQVMRIQPRVNDQVNEEWINDKSRYSYDGLKTQRLTAPLIKNGSRFETATWPEALSFIAENLKKSGANGDEIQAISGALADTESLVALKDLINKLGSENTITDNLLGQYVPSHGIDIRSNYLFNSTMEGLETADAVLLIGTNPRHEAAIVNTRFRKSYLKNPEQTFALIGEDFESVFGYENLGNGLKAVEDFFAGNGKGEFAEKWKKAKKPMVIIGSGITEHVDGAKIFSTVAKFVEKDNSRFITEDWNGFCVLQRAASRAAAYDIGFTPSPSSHSVTPKFIYLLSADDFQPSQIPKDAFVVYQGHHGDLGAQYADVCLPGAAYTEKSTTYVNFQGRSQLSRAAVPPPGASREDWKVVRALAEVIGVDLGYDDSAGIRDRMWEVCPTLVRYDVVEKPTGVLQGLKFLSGAKKAEGLKGGREGDFKKVIENFYRTDSISRASVIMSQCTRAFVEKQWFEHREDLPMSSSS